MKKRIKIKLESYDYKLLDKSVKNIVRTIHRAGVSVRGPIYLPTKTRRFTTNTSPNGDKKAREQFEIRGHKRLVVIDSPTPQAIDLLKGVNLEAGVDVKVAVV